MSRLLRIVVRVGLLGLLPWITLTAFGQSQARWRHAGGTGFLLPDPEATPGVVAHHDLKTICLTKWGKDRRHVTEAMKRKVCELYGLQCPPSTKALTGPTESRPVSIVNPRILGAEWMPARTVNSSRLFSERPDSTQDIHPMSHRFKMARIDTGRNSTRMIEFATDRNGAFQEYISEDVRSLLTESTVAAAGHPIADPQPAPADRVDGDSTFHGGRQAHRANRSVRQFAAAPVTHCRGNSTICREGIEIDHLIPRDLGGADDVKNLWPQPIQEARHKDRLEVWLNKQVCAGRRPLRDSQWRMAGDWTELYREMLAETSSSH